MEELSEKERRICLRDDADHSKVVLVFSEQEDSGGRYQKATPIDFSATGMGLELAETLEVGSLVILRTFAPDKKEFGCGYASAKVMWCRSHSGNGYRVGVAFTDPIVDPETVEPK